LPASPNSLKPFSPMIILKITEGEQSTTKWVMGYGPRDVGPAHYEFPIFEPGCPDTCFTIEPSDAGALITTAPPDTGLLNGESKDSEKIHDGLWIKIANTKIEVSLDHEANS